MAKKFNINLLLILPLSLLGLLISLYATWDSLMLHKTLIYKPLICDFSPLLKCITINSSKYSEIGGIPFAWFAVLYYWWLSISLIIKLNFKKPDFHVFLVFLTFLSFCISIFLIILQLKLQTLCIYCCTIITINIISFVLAYLNLDIRNLNINFKGISKYSFSIFLLMFIGTLFHIIFINPKNKSHTNSYITTNDTINVRYITQKYFKTPKPIKLIVIADYFCPYCRYLNIQLPNLIVDYKDKVEIVYINYPLNTTIAARAAILSKDYDEFPYFHNQMFINQKMLDSIFIINMVKKKHIDVDRFISGLNSMEVKSELDNNINSALELNCRGLPTLFINNTMVVPWNSIEQIKFHINVEINKI